MRWVFCVVALWGWLVVVCGLRGLVVGWFEFVGVDVSLRVCAYWPISYCYMVVVVELLFANGSDLA